MTNIRRISWKFAPLILRMAVPSSTSLRCGISNSPIPNKQDNEIPCHHGITESPFRWVNFLLFICQIFHHRILMRQGQIKNSRHFFQKPGLSPFVSFHQNYERKGRMINLFLFKFFPGHIEKDGGPDVATGHGTNDEIGEYPAYGRCAFIVFRYLNLLSCCSVGPPVVHL